MKATLLGTSCMVPTKERNVSGLYLEYNGWGVLFDCGEGTQRQMNIAGINRNKVKILCLSHWHADHVAGVLGLIQTVSSKEKDFKIVVIGPKETKKRLDMLLNATIWDNQLNLDVIEVTGKETQVVFEGPDFYVESAELAHVTPCVGFSFVQKDKLRINTTKAKEIGIEPGPIMGRLQQGEDVMFNKKKVKSSDMTYIVKGKKFTYIADTQFCQSAVNLATNANLLVAESTYAKEHQENATLYKHMTSTDAATIAKEGNVQQLVLTHLSQRYKNPKKVLTEAQKVFENTLLGKDFLEVKF